MKYLGLDWGEKRIGLALGDSEMKMASPFKVVGTLDEVIAVIQEEEVEAVVAGMPYSISNIGHRVTSGGYNEFLARLKKKIKIPVEIIDERLSSKAADALSGSKKTKADRDALAAMIILQSFFDRK